MKEVIRKFEPGDVIALVIIVGCITLIILHRDGIVTNVLTMITGYYFGQKTATKVITETIKTTPAVLREIE